MFDYQQLKYLTLHQQNNLYSKDTYKLSLKNKLMVSHLYNQHLECAQDTWQETEQTKNLNLKKAEQTPLLLASQAIRSLSFVLGYFFFSTYIYLLLFEFSITFSEFQFCFINSPSALNYILRLQVVFSFFSFECFSSFVFCIYQF